MSAPERDALVIGVCLGVALGGVVGAWLGYRVWRWVARHRERARANGRQVAGRDARRHAKHIPFTFQEFLPAQDARTMLKNKPRRIPLPGPEPQAYPTSLAVRPSERDLQRIPIVRGLDPAHDPTGTAGFYVVDHAVAAETARIVREDAVAAITGSGYKRAAAEIALDACTLAERAGGLESWVAAALRRAAAK